MTELKTDLPLSEPSVEDKPCPSPSADNQGTRTATSAARMRAQLPAVICGTLMLAVSLIHAGRPRLSWDEATTADVARRTPAEIWHLMQNVDGVFGPYYTLMRYWTALVGDSEIQLRMPSILAMAGAVALAAELGRRLFGPPVGTVAGLILVSLPNTSRYAAEARPYAFACFFSVLAVLLLLSALEKGGRVRWLGYGLAVLLLGASHVVALTTLAAHAVWVAMHPGRRRTPRTGREGTGPRRPATAWAITAAGALVLLAPLAYLGTQQRDTQLHWVPPITLPGIGAMPGQIVGSPEAAWLLIGLVLLAVCRPGTPAPQHSSRQAWWRPGFWRADRARTLAPVTVLALAPLAVVAVVSLVCPMWVARYLLVVLAPTAVLATITLTGDRFRWRSPAAVRTLGALLLLACVVVPAQREIRAPTAKNGPDYRSVAQLVADRQQTGDVIVYQPRNRFLRAGTDYYLRRLPGAPRDVLLRHPAAEGGRLAADEYPADPAHVAGAPGIWVVAATQKPDPATVVGGLRPLLNSAYQRVGFWQLKSTSVALYRLRGRAG
jgi:mannosyltransferase